MKSLSRTQLRKIKGDLNETNSNPPTRNLGWELPGDDHGVYTAELSFDKEERKAARRRATRAHQSILDILAQLTGRPSSRVELMWGWDEEDPPFVPCVYFSRSLHDKNKTRYPTNYRTYPRATSR